MSYFFITYALSQIRSNKYVHSHSSVVICGVQIRVLRWQKSAFTVLTHDRGPRAQVWARVLCWVIMLLSFELSSSHTQQFIWKKASVASWEINVHAHFITCMLWNSICQCPVFKKQNLCNPIDCNYSVLTGTRAIDICIAITALTQKHLLCQHWTPDPTSRSPLTCSKRDRQAGT